MRARNGKARAKRVRIVDGDVTDDEGDAGEAVGGVGSGSEAGGGLFAGAGGEATLKEDGTDQRDGQREPGEFGDRARKRRRLTRVSNLSTVAASSQVPFPAPLSSPLSFSRSLSTTSSLSHSSFSFALSLARARPFGRRPPSRRRRCFSLLRPRRWQGDGLCHRSPHARSIRLLHHRRHDRQDVRRGCPRGYRALGVAGCNGV